jgi:hypothetical protein
MPRATLPPTSYRRLGVRILVLCAGLCGCIREYHPEYHPETSYTVVQRIEYSTTVATVPARPAPSPTATPYPTVTPAPPAAPPRPSPPAPPPTAARGTASLAGEWVEHVPGTTCDRAVSIEEVDGVPYAKVRGCDGSDAEDALRTVSAKDGGLRAHRQDVHDTEVLDYRLSRAGPDELRGTIVWRDRLQGDKGEKTYPVVWSRGGAPADTATGPYASLAGHWSESLDDLDQEGEARGAWGRECNDAIAIEADAKGARAYDHFCYAGHFETSTLTLVGDEGGTLRFRLEGSARYGTVDYLLRSVDGRLQGFVVSNPAPGEKGSKPSHRGVTWSRR